MNPYARFRLVSNSVSAALIVAALATFGAPVFKSIMASAVSAGAPPWAALGAGIVVLVVFWLAMTEAIFPTLFRFNAVRRVILGKYYIEGTWLQAERDSGTNQRLAVIDIQPNGNGFIFSGYALNPSLEIESNTRIEFSRFDWPFMVFKYRNSLSDGADGLREGVGEIQFEMNRAAALRYNGFAQFVKNGRRVKIDGAKLTKNREIRKLRSLDERRDVLEKYWALFFNASLRTDTEEAAPAKTATRTSQKSETAERRTRSKSANAEEGVIHRRRNSDWRQEDETPVADRARKSLNSAKPVVVPSAEQDAEDEPEDDIDLAYETADSDADMGDEPETDTDAGDDTSPTVRRRGFRRSA